MGQHIDHLKPHVLEYRYFSMEGLIQKTRINVHLCMFAGYYSQRMWPYRALLHRNLVRVLINTAWDIDLHSRKILYKGIKLSTLT